MHCWRPGLWYPLKTQSSTRDGRNVKCHFCKAGAQGISTTICKEKRLKSTCEANNQRLLQSNDQPPSLEGKRSSSRKQQDTHLQPAPQFLSALVSYCSDHTLNCLHKWAFGYPTCRIWKLAISALIFYLGNFQKPEFALIGNSKYIFSGN